MGARCLLALLLAGAEPFAEGASCEAAAQAKGVSLLQAGTVQRRAVLLEAQSVPVPAVSAAEQPATKESQAASWHQDAGAWLQLLEARATVSRAVLGARAAVGVKGILEVGLMSFIALGIAVLLLLAYHNWDTEAAAATSRDAATKAGAAARRATYATAVTVETLTRPGPDGRTPSSSASSQQRGPPPPAGEALLLQPQTFKGKGEGKGTQTLTPEDRRRYMHAQAMHDAEQRRLLEENKECC